jgi:hypothetical protein
MKTATFKIKILPVQTTAVVVGYTTQDDTAVAGVDYIAKNGTFTILPNEEFALVDVLVVNPVSQPKNKQFKLLLTEVNGNAILPNPPFGICIIRTDDVPQDAGTLILDGLIANAWHDEIGRGGYFHQNSGTSEGQSIGIEGSFLSFEVLDGGTAEEQTAADWYRQNAKEMLDALGNGGQDAPCLRIPVPTNPNQITLLHWLFASKGPIPSQAINYTFAATKQGTKLVIPETVPAGPNGEAHKGAPLVFRIWRIYPATSTLLFTSPYSPAYDNEHPTGDTSIVIDEYQVDGGVSSKWTYNPSTKTVDLPLPSGAPNVSNWLVVYGYNEAGVIPKGAAQEAYPCWTTIPEGFSACAPDTFRWFDVALELATLHDDRAGMAEKWEDLRLASRKTAVRGQTLSDLREVIKPLPKFDVIPINSEPSGFYCYSDHPNAALPTPEQIAAGAGSEWSGFNFWSRIGGTDTRADPDVFYWSPEVMFYPDGWRDDIYNGSIQCTVPAVSGANANTVYQTQLGRGFNDEWRGSAPYQQPDQFLFLAMEINKKPAAGEHFYIYVSSTKYYDGETRYYADIGGWEEFQVGPSTDGGPRYFMIPRAEFKRKDSDNAVLPVGTRFENFGISAEFKGSVAYTFKIVALRIIGGPSEQWVFDNMQKAVKGGDMPFFPGAIPFATNAYMERQQFVGWNGNPFHGYQLADLWWFCASEAAELHANTTVNDLAIPNASGALTYPILAKTSDNVDKPKHALLMEQQLMFLKQAQDKYVADGGPDGPFAHTFVLNTAARMSIGNPTPHTWVYTNDDPNTRWCGYTARVIDSLGKIVFLTKSDPGFKTVRELAQSIALRFLVRLNVLWPDLNGKEIVNNEVTVRVYGSPTDYPDPAVSPPVTLYEEPHVVALFLRGCIWLKASGLLTAAQLVTVNAIGKRCLDYLELRWTDTPGSIMRYSWANFDPVTNAPQYYGFWAFEILSTLCYMIKNPSGAPEGADLDRAREWVRLHQNWLALNVRHSDDTPTP